MEADTLLTVDDGSDAHKEFCELVKLLLAEFEVDTFEGYIDVQRAAIAMMRIRNGYKFEQAEMRDPEAFHLAVMDRLLRYGTAADRQLAKALEALRARQKREGEQEA